MMLSQTTGKPFYTPGNINTARANVELKADYPVETYKALMYAPPLFFIIIIIKLRKAKDDKLG
jgi:hypothetical protein